MSDLLLTKRYVTALKARVTELSQNLAEGRCANFGDYREVVGRVKGLDDALVIFESAFKELEKDNDN